MWAAILEKTWAKIKGNYINADGGLIENGLHSLTGVPVFRYDAADISDANVAANFFRLLIAADAANYIMGAGTAGNGNNQILNSCGLAESHAYSILSAFTMTDSNGAIH